MLAIIRSLQEWRHFVEGAEHQVEIWTDHKNLEYFMSAKQLNRRQARWSLYLARFDFLLHHRPGKSMGKPDALSRRADHGTGTSDNSDIVLLTPKLFAVRALEGLEVVGPELDILRDIRKGVKDPKEEPVEERAICCGVKCASESRSKDLTNTNTNQHQPKTQYTRSIVCKGSVWGI